MMRRRSFLKLLGAVAGSVLLPIGQLMRAPPVPSVEEDNWCNRATDDEWVEKMAEMYRKIQYEYGQIGPVFFRGVPVIYSDTLL